MNNNKNTILVSFSNLIPLLKTRYPISRMAIFGSQARNDTNENSDIDILVSFNEPIGIEFIDLAEELEKLLGKKVDLVSMDSLKERHWEMIKKDLIYVC